MLLSISMIPKLRILSLEEHRKSFGLEGLAEVIERNQKNLKEIILIGFFQKIDFLEKKLHEVLSVKIYNYSISFGTGYSSTTSCGTILHQNRKILLDGCVLEKSFTEYLRNSERNFFSLLMSESGTKCSLEDFLMNEDFFLELRDSSSDNYGCFKANKCFVYTSVNKKIMIPSFDIVAYVDEIAGWAIKFFSNDERNRNEDFSFPDKLISLLNSFQKLFFIHFFDRKVPLNELLRIKNSNLRKISFENEDIFPKAYLKSEELKIRQNNPNPNLVIDYDENWN